MKKEDKLKQFQLEQVSELTNACVLTIICFLGLFTGYHFSNNFCISFARYIQKPANHGPSDETNTCRCVHGFAPPAQLWRRFIC